VWQQQLLQKNWWHWEVKGRALDCGIQRIQIVAIAHAAAKQSS
jgi:hypothetical protein